MTAFRLLAGDALLIAPFVGMVALLCMTLGRKTPMARRRTPRRLKRLMREPLPAPWDGAIVPNQRSYYVQRWGADIGRALRNGDQS